MRSASGREELREEMETGLLHQSRVTSNYLILMATSVFVGVQPVLTHVRTRPCQIMRRNYGTGSCFQHFRISAAGNFINQRATLHVSLVTDHGRLRGAHGPVGEILIRVII